MKKRCLYAILSLLITASLMLTGCTNETVQSAVQATPEPQKELIKVGFSQVGSESSWRVANSESMKSAFSEENGYELIFDDAKQKVENQYKAIRTFIQQKVDYIVLAPVTESGWDDILREAAAAGIPVIIVDRQVDADPNLYISWVGSDFLAEGQTAIKWLEDKFVGGHLNILHIKGTLGATSQLMRTQGLLDAVEKHEDWHVVATLEGDYTEAKAYEVMKSYLKTVPVIDVIYSENDNMSFGAIRALREAGYTFGRDGNVTIVSFDCVRSALEECLAGNINLCVECNPLHGPRVAKLIEQLEAGEIPAKMNNVEETYFDTDTITREMIDARTY